MPPDPNNPQNQAQQQQPQKPPHEVGWLEKRWRMVKTGVQSFGEYLLKPKTYLFAAAAAGVALLIGPAVAPLFASGAFGSLGAVTLPAMALKVASFVTVGVVLHMTIDMFKESNKADKETKVAHAQQQAQKRAADGPVVAQNRSPHDVNLDDINAQQDLPVKAAETIEHFV